MGEIALGSNPKILVEGTSLSGERSGVGRFTYELLKALRVKDAELHILTLDSAKREVDVKFLSNNITYLNRITQRIIWTTLDYLTIFKIEKYFKVDLDFAIYPNFKYLPTKLPSLTFIHDISYTKGESWGSSGFIRRITRWGKRSIGSNTTITTISSTIAKEISQFYNYPLEKILIINPGIAQTMLEAGQPGVIIVRKGFLVVGTFEKRKNLAFIIQAYNDLSPREQIDNPLTLVGRIGNDFEKISTLAKHNPNIKLVPNISDQELINLYQRSLFLISASNYEGFGMQVAESMYFGLGLILSNIAVHHEVSGNFARFFGLEDKSNLTNLLKSEVMNYPNDFHKQAKIIAQSYSWEVAAQKVITYFKQK